MSQRIEFINQSLLRCHLWSLIEIAGSKVPAVLGKTPPVVERLTADELLFAVEAYRKFLRSPGGLK